MTQPAESPAPSKAASDARSSSDATEFSALRRQIDATFDAHIPRGRPVALLQYPYDANVGNHMMWVGTTDYLRDRQIPVGYVAHGNNFDAGALRRAIGDGPILFLGGVTISRLWPRHAEIKRLIAAAFPRNPLISLPATCLFVDDEDKRVAGGLFGAHENVTVMARDPVSGAHAREAFPSRVNVVTVHDVALRLPMQPARSSSAGGILWLARADLEATGSRAPDGVEVFDWPDNLGDVRSMYLALRASGVFSRLRASPLGAGVSPAVNPPMAWLYRRASDISLAYGNVMLDRGKVLVTDRMHPHVLAALRRQHVVVLPDKFGKNRAVFDYSTHRFETVHFASTPAEALDRARELAA